MDRRVIAFTLALIAAIAAPLCASLGWARGLGVLGMAGGAAPSCSTPTTGTVFNEGFIGPGAENSYTVNQTSGTFDYDYQLPGVPPSGSCTEGFRYISDSWTENKGSIRFDIGTISYPATVYISIYLGSGSGGGVFRILQLDDDTSVPSRGVMALDYEAGGNRLQAWGSTDVQHGILNSIYTATWYEVRVELDATGADEGSSFYVNNVLQGTFTRGSVTGRYLLVGMVDGKASTEEVDLIVGRIYVDN